MSTRRNVDVVKSLNELFVADMALHKPDVRHWDVDSRFFYDTLGLPRYIAVRPHAARTHARARAARHVEPARNHRGRDSSGQAALRFASPALPRPASHGGRDRWTRTATACPTW